MASMLAETKNAKEVRTKEQRGKIENSKEMRTEKTKEAGSKNTKEIRTEKKKKIETYSSEEVARVVKEKNNLRTDSGGSGSAKPRTKPEIEVLKSVVEKFCFIQDTSFRDLENEYMLVTVFVL